MWKIRYHYITFVKSVQCAYRENNLCLSAKRILIVNTVSLIEIVVVFNQSFTLKRNFFFISFLLLFCIKIINLTLRFSYEQFLLVFFLVFNDDYKTWKRIKKRSTNNAIVIEERIFLFWENLCLTHRYADDEIWCLSK